MIKQIFILCMLINLGLVIAENEYILDNAELNGRTNGFLTDSASRTAMLVPGIFIILSIVAYMIDWGAMGVIVGCMVALGLLVMLQLIQFSVVSILSMIVMSFLFIFKLQQQ